MGVRLGLAAALFIWAAAELPLMGFGGELAMFPAAFGPTICSSC